MRVYDNAETWKQSGRNCSKHQQCDRNRAETKALIGGGGGAYSYIRVLPDEFLLKSTVMTTDVKRNSSRRTRIYEYTPPPPPPINALVSAMDRKDVGKICFENKSNLKQYLVDNLAQK